MTKSDFSDGAMFDAIRQSMHNQGIDDCNALKILCYTGSSIDAVKSGNPSIKSLEGIQRLTQLKDLGLVGNLIDDLFPLKDLRCLTSLRLAGNNIRG